MLARQSNSTTETSDAPIICSDSGESEKVSSRSRRCGRDRSDERGTPRSGGRMPRHARRSPPTCCERVKPANQASSLTAEPSQSARGTRAPASPRRGRPSMRVATKAGPGLTAVHRLYRSRSGGSYFYSTDRGRDQAGGRRSSATPTRGWRSTPRQAKASCLIPVYELLQGRGAPLRHHGRRTGRCLSTAGWHRGREVRFYVGRPAADPTFTFAVYPDTQQEVLRRATGGSSTAPSGWSNKRTGAGSAVRHPHR